MAGITFTKTTKCVSGDYVVRTVYARTNGMIDLDRCIFSANNGPWKLGDELQDEIHLHGREYATLREAKDAVRFHLRTKV